MPHPLKLNELPFSVVSEGELVQAALNGNCLIFDPATRTARRVQLQGGDKVYANVYADWNRQQIATPDQ